jgi:hypothetical protein
MPINAQKTFPQVEQMLYSIAWEFCNKYPVSFEDAKSQAYWGFMRAVELWNRRGYSEERAKFSTWCNFCTRCNMMNLITERSKSREIPTEINEELLGEAPSLSSPCLEILEGMSSEAREIVHLLLETPSEVLHEVGTPKQLLRSVKAHLVSRGRCKQRVEAACIELRMGFRAVWSERATV